MEPQPPLCANCRSPATARCLSCKQAPVLDKDATIPRYCNQHCLRSHWVFHKEVCRRLSDRTKFYRLMQLAQRLFYIHQEMTWMALQIESVEKAGTDLILRGFCHQDLKWPRDVQLFPHNLFPLKKDREAALTYLGTQQGLNWTTEFIFAFLGDIVQGIWTVFFHHSPSPRRTLLIEPGEPIQDDSGLNDHQVMVVKLRSGEEYAIDLTGAKYGYHNPVEEWNSFLQTRLHYHYLLHPAGRYSHRVIEKGGAKAPTLRKLSRFTSSRDPWVYIPNYPQYEILERMTRFMMAWQLQGTAVIKMLNTDYTTYENDSNNRNPSTSLNRRRVFTKDHFSIINFWRLSPLEFKRQLGNLVGFVEYNTASLEVEVGPVVSSMYATLRGYRIWKMMNKLGDEMWGFEWGAMEGFY